VGNIYAAKAVAMCESEHLLECSIRNLAAERASNLTLLLFVSLIIILTTYLTVVSLLEVNQALN